MRLIKGKSYEYQDSQKVLWHKMRRTRAILEMILLQVLPQCSGKSKASHDKYLHTVLVCANTQVKKLTQLETCYHQKCFFVWENEWKKHKNFINPYGKAKNCPYMEEAR